MEDYCNPPKCITVFLYIVCILTIFYIVVDYHVNETEYTKEKQMKQLTVTHEMTLDIGDLSNDGHGVSESFLISSNCPVEISHAGYIKACEKTGISFKDICNEYDESTISDFIMKNLFKKHNCPFLQEIIEKKTDENSALNKLLKKLSTNSDKKNKK